MLFPVLSFISGSVVQDPASFLHRKLAVDSKMTSVQAYKIENQIMSKSVPYQIWLNYNETNDYLL